ncbi:MAG: response regulator [Methanomicrobiales archaeon]|nr:response regulator [Methanomicrobiales archaeon]
MPAAPRILIVDDDTIITHLISTMLQKKGYTIAGIVAKGEESVVKAAELNPDLVIMDVTLAGTMDGMDAAHYIFQLFHCPIIFITGISDEEKLERLTCSRPYGIIFKPFTAIEINTSVRLALYNHSTRVTLLGDGPLGDTRKMMDNTREAVILLDKRGRIIFLNTFATWFVDIPQQQALMRHWRDVLMIINDQTGEEVKDPVTEVAAQMAGILYDTNTAIVTTTSKRRKVNLAVRPVKDDRDRLLAVLISLKEKPPKA